MTASHAATDVSANVSQQTTSESQVRQTEPLYSHPAAIRICAPNDRVPEVVPTCHSLQAKSENKGYGCPNSRFTGYKKSADGEMVPFPVPCKRSDCAYCARRVRQQYLARVREGLRRKNAIGETGPFQFLTLTIRAYAGVSVPNSFRISKSSVADALAAMRRKKGTWPGFNIENWGTVTDVQPKTGMAHEHALWRVRLHSDADLPSQEQMTYFLHHAYNDALRKHLGLEKLPYYRGECSLGFVKLEPVRDEEAVARYISKPLADVTMPRYGRHRRLSTSRGLLPPLAKSLLPA